jgi:DNA mismatch repair ATPase MutS
MKYHNKLFLQKRYCELLVRNAENELNGIDYDFSAFDGAPEKADGDHSYSLDLDMFGNRSFFQSINRTVTSFGKNRLADSLLDTYERKADIVGHQDALKELSADPDLLNRFRVTGQLSETEDLDIHCFSRQFMQTKPLAKSLWRYFIYIIPVVFAVATVLYVVEVIPFSVVGMCWTLAFILSLAPLKDIKEKMNLFEKRMSVLERYSRLLKIIETEQFNSPMLKELQEKIKGDEPASSAICQLESYSNNLDQSFNVLGLILLNPVFFWNIHYAIRIENWILRHKDNIAIWLKVLAEFDSLVSFAFYAYNHPDYIYPEVSETFVFDGKGLGHPLINRNVCVRNDVTVNKNPFFLVVTGANMAGKSTYLRTIGINLTLACAGAPVCASSLKFYPFRLVTNLRTSDSLTDNESYFFAELKRLKMIIDRLQSGEQLFIILDEILKGTNSEDKQKGSIALMKQLVSLNGNGIIATHDLVLGNLEKEFPDAIKNYRFEADIKDEQLSFTYQIREGVAQNMNASFLMRKMGITGL